MSAEQLTEFHRNQELATSRELGFIDFVLDEVQSAVAGKASERQDRKSRQEIVNVVWSVSGPLLAYQESAWHEHLDEVSSKNTLLKLFERFATERAFSTVREDGQRHLALQQLRAPDQFELQVHELGDRISVFFEELNDHVRVHKPRLPSDAAVRPVLTRMFATFITVNVAAVLERNGQPVVATNVSRCSTECLRAVVDYGRLFRMRSIPALPAERLEMEKRREDERRFDQRLLALAHEDDEFADMGD